MPGGPAGDDPDALHVGELGRRQSDVGQVRLPALEGVAPSHRVQDRLRLFVDLLQHEVRVAAFFRRGRVPRDLGRRARHRLALRVLDDQGISRKHRQFVVLQEDHVARVGEDRGHVRRGERPVLAHAHHERAARARGDDGLRLPFAQDGDRIAAADLLDRGAHRPLQAVAVF